MSGVLSSDLFYRTVVSLIRKIYTPPKSWCHTSFSYSVSCLLESFADALRGTFHPSALSIGFQMYRWGSEAAGFPSMEGGRGRGGDRDIALTRSRVLCSCSCVTAQRCRAPCTSQGPSSLGNENLCPEARYGNKWHWNLLAKFTVLRLNADFHNPVGVC